MTSVLMSVIGEVSASTISGGSPYVLDVFEGSPTVLLPTLSTDVVAGFYADDYIAIARQGGCNTSGNGFRPIVGSNPREFDEVAAMAFGPFDASDVDMSVPYLTMALCYTRHLDDPFVEQVRVMLWICGFFVGRVLWRFLRFFVCALFFLFFLR